MGWRLGIIVDVELLVAHALADTAPLVESGRKNANVNDNDFYWLKDGGGGVI